ncbi:hypothetical protein H9P43_007089 [Blastocladiella emersonii ATCC 22665]|nr:hypothetical protein H9P43_007089 [Blastocladiella emersonii ATCC 22665]
MEHSNSSQRPLVNSLFNFAAPPVPAAAPAPPPPPPATTQRPPRTPAETRATDALLATLNNPAVCDVAFQPASPSAPVHASRAVLAATSPYFRTMFTGGWYEGGATRGSATARDPITTPTWLPAPLLLTLVHLYSGWAPGDPVPSVVWPVLAGVGVEVDPGDRKARLDLDEWSNMFEIAEMLELPDLATRVRDAMVGEMGARVNGIVRARSVVTAPVVLPPPSAVMVQQVEAAVEERWKGKGKGKGKAQAPRRRK